MAFVVDASIAASWAFPDEGHPVASEALNRVRTEAAQVPSLWWFEVRNTLIVNERRGRITEADTAAFLLDIGRLPIVIDRTPRWQHDSDAGAPTSAERLRCQLS